MKEKTKKWLKFALIRAIRTISQSALGVMGASAMISEVNWMMVISASLLSGIISILTSLTGLPEVDYEV